MSSEDRDHEVRPSTAAQLDGANPPASQGQQERGPALDPLEQIALALQGDGIALAPVQVRPELDRIDLTAFQKQQEPQPAPDPLVRVKNGRQPPALQVDLPDLAASARKTEPIPGLAMWTDDYSNLYRILR